MSVVSSVFPPLSGAESDPGFDLERRFSGVARAYGAPALKRFRMAHVCVIGVGGVGSWATEALARSAIGQLTLIDLDNVAESNVNRQLHALSDTLGMAKVSALHQRIIQINPLAIVNEVEDFVTPDNLAQMIPPDRFDWVIDAMDNTRAKAALIAHCREHGIHIVTLGSAGGQTDPTRIRITDLGLTEQEPLLAKVRKRLRREYGFQRGERCVYKIDAVYSTEPVRMPGDSACVIGETENDADQLEIAAIDTSAGLNCAGYGSTVTVTATFGLVAAGHVLRKLAGLC